MVKAAGVAAVRLTMDGAPHGPGAVRSMARVFGSRVCGSQTSSPTEGANMTNVTIFGKGNMGSAIAQILEAGGATISHIDTSHESAELNDGLIILAVPYPALQDVATTYAGQLAGKIVVDITNPVDFEDFGPIIPAAGSAAQELAAALPESTILKAFNTNFAATLANKSIGGETTTVLIAGDDPEAKALLTAAITAGGVQAVDVGPLARARELEAVAFLQIALAVNEKIAWTGGLSLVK